jgi:hypothetical protein
MVQGEEEFSIRFYVRIIPKDCFQKRFADFITVVRQVRPPEQDYLLSTRLAWTVTATRLL